jgi:hypothetical protein
MPHKDPAARRAWRRKYYKTAKGKAIITRGTAKWQSKNRYKMTAAQCVYRARTPNYYRTVVRVQLYKPTYPEPECCEGCGIPFAATKKGSCMDHDHMTGKFRGYLCCNCNWALGHAKDSRVILQLLIDYLDRDELLR